MLKRLAAGIFLLVCFIYLLDYVARIPVFESRYFNPSLVCYDQYTLIKLKPNLNCRLRSKEYDVSVKTNSLGLRYREVPNEKVAGVYRILVIGDSHVFGYGVEQEEAFPALLEQELNKYPGKQKIEIINCGVPGWDGFQGYEYFNKYSCRLKPDMIINLVCVNDFSENGFQYYFFVLKNKKHEIEQFIKYYLKAKDLYCKAIISGNELLPKNLRLIYAPELLPALTMGIFFQIYKYPDNEVNKILENKITLSLLNDYYKEALLRNVKILFIIQDRRLAMEDSGLNGQEKRYFQIRNILRENFKNNNMPYIDLAIEVKKKYPQLGGIPGFNNDMHFNVQGNRLVAEVILENDMFRNMLADR